MSFKFKHEKEIFHKNNQQTFNQREDIGFPQNMNERYSMETVNNKNNDDSRLQLSQGQLIYIKDNDDAWVPGTVVDVSETTVTVKTVSGKVVSIYGHDVHLRAANSNLADCSRLTELTPLNEATVLDCLHQRFLQDVFYTYAGSTVIAVNPLKELAHLYSIDRIHEYHTHNQLLGPHIYAIAENAYTAMVRELGQINQSIIVSGESGAGKTVSAKHLLRYLTVVSSPEHERRSLFAGSAVERRVLDSNPILEAFGNAATPRNDNSSRFGKFIQLQFHRTGYILGGAIQTYLLEKTRVIHQGVGENTFHIFYQLLRIRELPEIPAWLDVIKAEVAKLQWQNTAPQDAETVALLDVVEAMSDIGVPPETQISIFQVLVAILQLTAIHFVTSKDGEASSMSDDEDFIDAMFAAHEAKDECARILGISPLNLHHTLLNRHIVSGTSVHRSVYVKPVNVEEARSRKDCLAMLLYARLFDWLVDFINQQIKSLQFDKSISLLDIYGFEAFEINGLEQLCINYANERLQQHYVSYFLRDLQTEYEMEQIEWSCIQYRDNKNCVESLDGLTGVFGVLNEEVQLSRKSNESGLCGRIVASCGGRGFVRKSRAGSHDTGFFVRHYAGDVLYTVTGTVAKNKDNIPAELFSLLASSENSFVLNLFTDEELAQMDQPVTLAKVKKKKTVLTKFKSSLDSLMSSLGQSDTHYIRCIKPNPKNQASSFNRRYVLQQLQACGTLETVQICRMGYSARMPYPDFTKRYGIFLQASRTYRKSSDEDKNQINDEEEQSNNEYAAVLLQKIQSHLSYHDGHTSHKKFKRLTCRTSSCEQEQRTCLMILMAVFQAVQVQECCQQFGRSKIFLTQNQLECLEHKRAQTVSALVTKVQSLWRRIAAQQSFERLKRVTLGIQRQWRATVARRKFCKIRSAIVKIQSRWRQHKLRMAVKQLATSSRIVKRALKTWIRRRQFKLAIQTLRQAQPSTVGSQSTVGSDLGSLSYTTISSHLCEVGQRFSNEFKHGDTTLIALNNKEDDRNNDDDMDMNFDISSQWSDDSGVMIKDDALHFSVDASFEAPPIKRQKLSILKGRDWRIGDGVITCRRLTKPGFRFHVRKSVLPFGNRVHFSELVHGLADALLEESGGVNHAHYILAASSH